jgi:hypothetical protein
LTTNEVANEVCNPAVNGKLVNSKKLYGFEKLDILKKKLGFFCDPHWILGAIIIYQISAGK